MRKIIREQCWFVVILLLTTGTILAQNSQSTLVTDDGTGRTSRAPITKTAMGNAALRPARSYTIRQTSNAGLANLPEADTLIYINSQRILNEVLPKVLAEQDMSGIRSAFNDIKQHAGIDPSKLDYLVIAIRFRKPSPELKFVPPELMMVMSGDLNAESLMTLAKTVAQDKLHEEKYGSKTLGVMTIDDITRRVETNPMLRSLSDVAIVPLNGNTIAIGTTNYLKAAIDAADGKARISAESLNSLLRDQGALVSIAGSPLTWFSKSFGLLGTEGNARTPNCDSKFGTFYAAVTMDATRFMLRGAMNADNPDTAKVINSLLSGLLQQVASAVPDKDAQSALKALSLTAPENEVVLNADIPQQVVIDFLREKMKPAKKQEETPSATPAKKRRPIRRRNQRPKP